LSYVGVAPRGCPPRSRLYAPTVVLSRKTAALWQSRGAVMRVPVRSRPASERMVRFPRAATNILRASLAVQFGNNGVGHVGRTGALLTVAVSAQIVGDALSGADDGGDGIVNRLGRVLLAEMAE
jgi:hypothetical protein